MDQAWDSNDILVDSPYYDTTYPAMFDSMEGRNENQNGFTVFEDQASSPVNHVHGMRGRHDSGYYSPEQKLLQLSNNGALHGMVSGGVMPVFMGQHGFMPQSTNAMHFTNSPEHISNHSHGFANDMTNNKNYIEADTSQDQAEEAEPAKVKKTRKRKECTEEEKAEKKKAFLERNRVAAKKCRQKRKKQQDHASEKVMRLGQMNTSMKVDVLNMKALIDDLTRQCQGIVKYRPEVDDELSAIKAGHPLKPPAFAWHHEHGLLPISEMPPGYQPPVVEDPFLQLLNDADFEDDAEEADSPAAAEMPQTIRADSVASCVSQQPAKTTRKRKAKAKQPERLDTSFGQNDMHNSNSSTPLTGTSDSQNSGRDSGVGNITPMTANMESPAFLDEGIPYSPGPLKDMPLSDIDPMLLEPSLNLNFFDPTMESQSSFLDSNDFADMYMFDGPAF